MFGGLEKGKVICLLLKVNKVLMKQYPVSVFATLCEVKQRIKLFENELQV